MIDSKALSNCHSTISHFKPSPRTSTHILSSFFYQHTCYNTPPPCQTPTYSDPRRERDCSFFPVLSAFFFEVVLIIDIFISADLTFTFPAAFVTLCFQLDTHYLQLALLRTVSILQKLYIRLPRPSSASTILIRSNQQIPRQYRLRTKKILS